MAEQTKIQIPGLDDYGVAADLLDERGFTAVAASLREMRRRVLELFMHWEPQHKWTAKTWVFGGWEYATDGRVLIRVKTDQPDELLDDAGDLALGRLRLLDVQYLDALSEPRLAGDWVPLLNGYPRPTILRGDGVWEKWQQQPCRVAGRDIANGYVYRMSKLPECEVLDDSVSDYDYTPDMSLQPLRFRFRCGEGVVMPMLPDEASATQAAEREAPGEESVVESRDLRDGVMALRRDTT